MSDRDGREWLSAYLFIAPHLYTGACDRIVRTVVPPFIARCREQRWIDRYFFIRYSEDGPHLRLRLRGLPTVLDQEVKPALIAHAAAAVVDLPDASADPRSEQAPTSPPPVLPMPAVRELRWIAYEPEYQRYGGADGITVAEAQFEASSDAVLTLLERCNPDDRRAKLGQALLAMVVAIHVFHGDRLHAAEFALMYGSNYLRAIAREEARHSQLLGAFGSGFTRQADSLIPFVEQAWEQLVEHDPLPEPLEQYHRALWSTAEQLRALWRSGRLSRDGRVIADWSECLARIVPPYIHMFNNRLGVTVPEESYLAYLLARAFGAPASEEILGAVAGASRP
jgi:thiopeptide-type bacteriocin biosynthesis protein